MSRPSPRFALVLFPVLFVGAACSGDEEPNFRNAVGKHQVAVKSVWKEKKGTPGKQNLAILDDDIYTHSHQFLMYGDKSGKLSVRSFVGQFIIFTNPGNVEQSEDTFYKFRATFPKETEMKVTLTGKDGSTFDLTYEKLTDDAKNAAGAVKAADQFYEKFDALLAGELDTLAKLKAFIRLHERTHDFSPGFDKAFEWQFEFEPAQIEADLILTAPKSKLAGVDISADGSDEISKHFKKNFGKTWTPDEDLPTAEEAISDLPDDADLPFFLQFEKGIAGIDAGILRKGMKKFAKFTITVLHPFECEDTFEYVRDFHWVLQDGSILSYLTSPECD